MSETPETGASASSTGPAHPPPKRRTVSPRLGWSIAAATALAVALLGVAVLPSVRPATPPSPTSAAPQPASGVGSDAGKTVVGATVSRPDGSADGLGRAGDTRPTASDAGASADAGLPSDRRAAAGGGDGGPVAAPGTREPDGAGAASDDSPDGGNGLAAPAPANASGHAGGRTQTRVDRSAADCVLDDKDIAREAWRRNWPTICPTTDGKKSAIFLPIKGTLDGQTHEYRERPNSEARINLPAGESLLTMRQYKLHRLGFEDLRVVPWEGRERGTHLRMKVLPGASEPTFEIKDGYAKVTIDAPLPGAE